MEMKILFATISAVPNIGEHTISLDLLRELQSKGHEIYILCALERREKMQTYLAEEMNCQILRVKIGNNKKANLIEKGITTLMLPQIYIAAIKKFFSDVKFDLVLYPTPPVTHAKTAAFIKKRDGARTYLLLKDIFPQNSVDIGMMQKRGIKGLIYRHFRRQEKKLYALSDRIGCMSQANVEYLLKHNPEIDPAKVEICPNAIAVRDMSVDAGVRAELREKYEIPQDKKVFIYGGNLGRPQGIPFLIQCLERQKANPDAYFLIVGDGTEYQKLEAWFAEAKPANAKLVKRLPKEDYDRLVAACDVGMIFLDHRFTIPNFPSRLLSYLQAKLPVLCCTDPNTDIGKVCTEGGFGFACESNDPAGFNAQIRMALEADLPAMGEAGFDYLNQHYTAEKACNIVLQNDMVSVV